MPPLFPNSFGGKYRAVITELLASNVLSVESLLKLDVSSSSFKIEKSALREVQLAYCSTLASSCASVSDIAKITSSRACSTSLASADSILCGGFQCGHITELIGDSAVGKSQLLMQVAAHCCISHSQGPADVMPSPQVLYIHDGHQLCASRLLSIAKHLAGFRSDSDSNFAPLNLHLLKSITVYNAVELWSILHEIELRPASVHGMKLILIDGFSCIMASSIGGRRSKSGQLILDSITASLKRLSVIHKTACVVTNHIISSSKFSRSVLGTSWSAACATSLVLVSLNAELGHSLLSVKKSNLHPAGASTMLRIEDRGVLEFSSGLH